MTEVSLADAKARLSEIVNRVETGETVRITRRGKPVVEMRAIERRRTPIDFDALQVFRDSMPMGSDSTGIIRRMRDRSD